MKKVKIALLGLGNVGRGSIYNPTTNKEENTEDQVMKLKFLKILVRDLSKNRVFKRMNKYFTMYFERDIK